MLAKPRVSGNSGAITTPIFKRIARRWVSATGSMRESVTIARRGPVRKARLSLPRVEGLPATVAADRLLAAGYRTPAPQAIVAFHPVVQQPADGRDLYVDLELEAAEKDTATTEMPDLSGLSMRQAVHWSHAAGIDVKIEGRGMVVSQIPKAGEPLLATAVLRCR